MSELALRHRDSTVRLARRTVTGREDLRVRDFVQLPRVVRRMDKYSFTLGVLGISVTQYVMLRHPDYFAWYFCPTMLALARSLLSSGVPRIRITYSRRAIGITAQRCCRCSRSAAISTASTNGTTSSSIFATLSTPWASSSCSGMPVKLLAIALACVMH